MIVPMKKISVIMQAKDADSALNRLRSLGLLHVEHSKPPKGEDINALLEDIVLNDSANKVLADFSPGAKEQKQMKEPTDWRFSARHIIDLGKRFSQLEEFSVNLKKSIANWQEWGDFEPDSIRNLSENNIFVRLYRIPVKQLKDLPASVILKKISVIEGIANCVLISRQKIDIPFKEVALPKMSLTKMKERIAEDSRVMDLIKSEIQKQIYYKESFAAVKKDLQKELEFRQALSGMGGNAGLVYLTGYSPFDNTKLFLETARQEKWAILVEDPSKDDLVPTLIRVPAWVSIIRPVFKLLEIVPGYHELDISFLFLIFFSLFFGILIGDAGYGAVYLFLTFVIQRKIKKRGPEFFLFYTLSFCAIVWGLLTGTFFGREWLTNTGFKPFIPALNETKTIQTFCFFLGALHLSLAHSWRALLKLPSPTALVDIGWILVLWAAFFFAKFLILSLALPPYTKWLLISGVILVVLFSQPQKNILKAIGKGLGDLALSLMNNFTDVVSYVRLFAVGLAGVAIADTFNAMAAGVASNNVVALIASGLIIVAGHGLNLILGPMSVLVHGVRLNVLEFSGHAGVTWSGFAYKPFKD